MTKIETPIGFVDVLNHKNMGDLGTLYVCRVRDGRIDATSKVRGIFSQQQVIEHQGFALIPCNEDVYDLDARVASVAFPNKVWILLPKEVAGSWPAGVMYAWNAPSPPRIDYFEVYEVTEVP